MKMGIKQMYIFYLSCFPLNSCSVFLLQNSNFMPFLLSDHIFSGTTGAVNTGSWQAESLHPSIRLGKHPAGNPWKAAASQRWHYWTFQSKALLGWGAETAPCVPKAGGINTFSEGPMHIQGKQTSPLPAFGVKRLGRL